MIRWRVSSDPADYGEEAVLDLLARQRDEEVRRVAMAGLIAFEAGDYVTIGTQEDAAALEDRIWARVEARSLAQGK